MLKINVLENKTVSPSNSSNTHSQTNVIPLISVKNSSPNEEKVIGQGGIGKVIEDINNPGYVIKIFSKNTKLANLKKRLNRLINITVRVVPKFFRMIKACSV